jgi:hypothetical protein
MEVRYGDGSYAGPKDWTVYRKFNATFSPDYPNGTIILKPEFLNSLRDGQRVTLTTTFYSGKRSCITSRSPQIRSPALTSHPSPDRPAPRPGCHLPGNQGTRARRLPSMIHGC